MKSRHIRPLPGYVLLEDVDIDNTIGIFEVAGLSEKNESSFGKVVLVGDSVRKKDKEVEHSPVHTGEIVVYKKYFDGARTQLNGNSYQLVPFKDLVGTIEEK